MTIQEYKELLENTNKCKCTINNNKIDVKGDILIMFNEEIPYKFGEVQGDFTLFALENNFKGIENLPDKVTSLSLDNCNEFPKKIEVTNLSVQHQKGLIEVKNASMIEIIDSEVGLITKNVNKLSINDSTVKLDVKEAKELALKNLRDGQILLNEIPKVLKKLTVINVKINEDFPLNKITSSTKIILEDYTFKSYLGLIDGIIVRAKTNVTQLKTDYVKYKKNNPMLSALKFSILKRMEALA